MTRSPMVAAEGRLVAITGAARGIGLACAQALASRGALVAIGDLDEELAANEAQRIGDKARGFALDVTDAASFTRFLEAACAHFHRPLGVLVNNAGIMWVGPHEQEPDAVAMRQMDVNFHGTVRGMKLALPAMRERGNGQIVNVASAASKLPTAGEATYSATKHAVYGYCMAVREELRGTGVELSLVMPVIVDTELAAGTDHGRGVRLEPHDVADAVVSVIEHPRFEVFVPRSVGALARLVSLAPQRGRDMLYAAVMPNQVRDGDAAARARYEGRLLP